MESFVLGSFMLLPLMGSLLLATRLWGKQAVIRWVAERAFDLGWLAEEVGSRLLAAVRALVGVAIDRDALRDELIEEVEETLFHKFGQQCNNLNNKYYDLDCKVRALEGQPQGDRY